MTPAQFLATRCFYCPKLRARVSPECCRARQNAEVRKLTVLGKQVPDEMSANDYCASKKCVQGREYR